MLSRMPLKTQIEQLASTFVSQVLATLRTASLDELVGVVGSGSGPSTNGKRLRRTHEDLENVRKAIVALLKKTPKGLRAEEIRMALNLEAKKLPRPLAAALETGEIKKKGQKRATTYFAK